MLDQRRKQKAAAAVTTAAAAPTVADAPKKARKPAAKKAKASAKEVDGKLRSIAIGRAYREYEAPMEDGRPAYRSVFDPAGRAAEKLPKDFSKERLVPMTAFLKHLNETVARKVFGAPLRPKVLRMFLEGICDQGLTLAEGGWKIKFPNLCTVEQVERKERKARNPRTNETVHVPRHKALSTKPTRSAKAYMAQAGV
jgi:nucleoid DNA-binding protein